MSDKKYLSVRDARKFAEKAKYYLPVRPGGSGLPALDFRAGIDRLIDDYADLKRFYEKHK